MDSDSRPDPWRDPTHDAERSAAHRQLRLMWVILVSIRYRAALENDWADLNSLCCGVEKGVADLTPYNVAVRELCERIRSGDSYRLPTQRPVIDELLEEIDRLQAMLRE